MIYFDTDFLVNFLIEQDSKKHQLTRTIFKEANRRNDVFISLLCAQETVFVLGKLGVDTEKIESIIQDFWKYNPVNYSIKHFDRAVELSKAIGFKHINDCLHTAVAEIYCDELYTFNQDDFKKIKRYTSLKINIL